ncbi:MAG: hypothetical protein ACK4YP_11845, partial [Myxococcota bacterium]
MTLATLLVAVACFNPRRAESLEPVAASQPPVRLAVVREDAMRAWARVAEAARPVDARTGAPADAPCAPTEASLRAWLASVPADGTWTLQPQLDQTCALLLPPDGIDLRPTRIGLVRDEVTANYALELSLSEADRAAVADLTGANVGRTVAVVAAGRVLSAPKVMERV